MENKFDEELSENTDIEELFKDIDEKIYLIILMKILM